MLTDEVLVIADRRFQEPLSQPLGRCGVSANSCSLTSTSRSAACRACWNRFSASSARSWASFNAALVRSLAFVDQPIADKGPDEREEHDQYPRGEHRGVPAATICAHAPIAEGRCARIGSSRRKRCKSSASSWAET